jgi:hypothetical protein
VNRRLAFHPDGTRVAFTASTRVPELWVLENVSYLLMP